MLRQAYFAAAVIAPLLWASPAASQAQVGTTEHVFSLHSLCFRSTSSGELDDAPLRQAGFELVSEDEQGNRIFEHPSEPGLAALMETPERSCIVVMSVESKSALDDYAARFPDVEWDTRGENFYSANIPGRKIGFIFIDGETPILRVYTIIQEGDAQ